MDIAKDFAFRKLAHTPAEDAAVDLIVRSCTYGNDCTENHDLR